MSISGIKREIENSGKLKELDFLILFTLLGNNTIFEEFKNRDDFPKVDSIGNAVAESKHDKKDLRSLAYLLQQRTIVQEETKLMKGSKTKNYKLMSFLQYAATESPELRDLILKIGRNSPSFTIFSTFDT